MSDHSSSSSISSSSNSYEASDNKKSIPSGIWALGMVSFLINTSTVMIFGFCAVYLKNALHVGTALIALLEATVEALSYLMKVVSGIASDYMRKRKAIMAIGVAFSAFTRPIFALSSSFGMIFFARIMDRIGNGIQATPRDALVGDLSNEHNKGASYGLRQTLATAGSFAGGIIGMAAMYFSDDNYHMVFFLASIPAIGGFLVLTFFVKDPAPQGESVQKRDPIRFSDMKKLQKPFWLLMVIVSVFMLSRLSEAFLLLHANQNFGLQPTYIPLVVILYNGFYSLTSYPIGKLSDKMSRYTLLAIGAFVLVIADVILATGTQLWHVLAAICLWGVQMGISQAMFVALVADTSPKELRGTSFGIFYLVSAVSLIVMGKFSGEIAEAFGEAYAFSASGVVATLALMCLIFIPTKKRV
jgi:MFS family permease